MSLVVRTALPDERLAALELLFARDRPADRQTRVRSALDAIDQGVIDPAGLFILASSVRTASPAGVVLAQRLAAAAGQLTVPVVRPGVPAAAADALTAQVCDWLQRQGARLLQCLPADDETPFAAPLLRHGFIHPTGLTFLRHDLLHLPPIPSSSHLVCLPFPATSPADFQTTLLRTYEGTLDCPEVNGVRSIDEVIEGHRAQGMHDPARWWLVTRAGRPVAVLLLTETASGEWELSYVGVVPEARGQGAGAAVVAFALNRAREGGAAGVTLSVDDRNRPALALYRRAGFVAVDHRELFVMVPPAATG